MLMNPAGGVLARSEKVTRGVWGGKEVGQERGKGDVLVSTGLKSTKLSIEDSSSE